MTNSHFLFLSHLIYQRICLTLVLQILKTMELLKNILNSQRSFFQSGEAFNNYKGIHEKQRPDFPFRYPSYNNKYKKYRRFIKLLNKNI